MAGFGVLRFGLLVIVVTPGLQARCGAGRFGEACRYSCNCQVECDKVTGACPGSCTAGWVKTGQLCQKENIAYKKSASSTTNTLFPGWSPRNAVDGNNSINGESNTCFHGNEGKNELTIDLGYHYKLYHIRFYLRHEYNKRIANSVIYLDGVRSKVCYTFPPSVPNNPTDVVCDDVARFLTIENPGTGAQDDTPLNICEIEIYHCSNGTFGENCNFFCHCGSCDVTTGVCTGNCFVGWTGERCDMEVPEVADSSESTTTDIRTIALSTTVGVFAVIIVIFTVFFLRIHSSDKRSEDDKTTAPSPSPTADHIYTTNSSTSPATYEPFKPTEDNPYTELQERNYYGNT